MTIARLRIAGVVNLFVGLGALAGGGALVVKPDGRLLRMPVTLLAGSPFSDFLIPGLVLFFVVGGSNIAGGILAMSGHRRGAQASPVAGVVLIGWISTQMALLGYLHPIQLVYFGLGVLIVILAARSST